MAGIDQECVVLSERGFLSLGLPPAYASPALDTTALPPEENLPSSPMTWSQCSWKMNKAEWALRLENLGVCRDGLAVMFG